MSSYIRPAIEISPKKGTSRALLFGYSKKRYSSWNCPFNNQPYHVDCR